MKALSPDRPRLLSALAALLLFSGCSHISERTHAYLGSPSYAPAAPASVQILQKEPPQPFDRLGEIMLGVEGNPSREAVEKKLRQAAAKLGANAVFITYDRMHVFPIVYGGWYGPPGLSEGMRRDIVAVAVRTK